MVQTTDGGYHLSVRTGPIPMGNAIVVWRTCPCNIPQKEEVIRVGAASSLLVRGPTCGDCGSCVLWRARLAFDEIWFVGFICFGRVVTVG